jgi:hypothetical protein
VSNTDNYLYTSLQAARSTKTTFSLKQQKEELVHNFYKRCMSAFHTHIKAGHGWSVEAHYKKAIAVFAQTPDHDKSGWTDNKPGPDKAKTLYDNYITALKAIIFLEGLLNTYNEYNDQLANAFAKNNNIYPKRTPIAKERVARHRTSAAAAHALYAGDPAALAFATSASGG